MTAGFVLVYTTLPGVVNRVSLSPKNMTNSVYLSVYYSLSALGTWLPILVYSNFGIGMYVCTLLLVFFLALGLAQKHIHLSLEKKNTLFICYIVSMDVRSEIKELVKKLTDYQRAYYVDSKPLVSDMEYDRLYDELVKLERENPDIIIVTAHSGAGTDDGVTASFLLEAQALTGARKSSGVDLFIYGHDHTANITSVTDLDGKTLSLVNGGGNNLTKSVFTLEFDENGDLASYSVESSLLPLADYVAGLDAAALLSAMQSAREGLVSVVMPQFSYADERTLNDCLCALGMPSAFVRGQADFSGIQQGKGEVFYISQVLHKAYISVDEKGTQAGAAAAVIVADGVGSSEPISIERTVLLDRPFLYLIVDNATNLPLLISTVTSVA